MGLVIMFCCVSDGTPGHAVVVQGSSTLTEVD